MPALKSKRIRIQEEDMMRNMTVHDEMDKLIIDILQITWKFESVDIGSG